MGCQSEKGTLLTLSFVLCSLLNVIADRLAAWGHDIDLGYWFLEENPTWLGPLLMDDSIGVTKTPNHVNFEPSMYTEECALPTELDRLYAYFKSPEGERENEENVSLRELAKVDMEELLSLLLSLSLLPPLMLSLLASLFVAVIIALPYLALPIFLLLLTLPLLPPLMLSLPLLLPLMLPLFASLSIAMVIAALPISVALYT
ncbi:unnamed protein product [Prunus armeniaca]